ncbi:MarC family protein [Bordetella sp. FB-8]|uniref:MarC family protein n=1 Tax=Bordetella sp. FB-8 TaxID=1159870 RepID=UPI00036506E8|nr:MarC family protein [Bordetella sp. FB-8]
MIWPDLVQLSGAVLLILGAVLPVVNPLGDAPIFLKMTPGCDEETRAFLAKRIAFYSFIFVLGSLLLGSFVLAVFGISIPVVQVAGGAIVCALAWKVLGDMPKAGEVKPDQHHAKIIALGRAITPLTLPMTIDAGVISVAITVGAFHSDTLKHTVIQLLADIVGAAVIALTILLTYRYAHRVSKWIGDTGTTVLIRLSAFMMLCIGVGICWNGIKSLLMEVGVHG